VIKDDLSLPGPSVEEGVLASSISTASPLDEWTGCPEPSLRLIAEAGFTHVHWAHQLFDDFLYTESEIEQIRRWLKGLGLRMLDLHASGGVEKNYGSQREYERLAGVELVANRIGMTAALGGDVIVLHLPGTGNAKKSKYTDLVCRSFDSLRPIANERGVRIALENGDFEMIEDFLNLYEPEYMGLCYDAGHGNALLDRNGLDHLERLKNRLIAIHLHGNGGHKDIHLLPFHPNGTVDWDRLARIVAASPYERPVTCEANAMYSGFDDPPTFLSRALETCDRFRDMVMKYRQTRTPEATLQRSGLDPQQRHSPPLA